MPDQIGTSSGGRRQRCRTTSTQTPTATSSQPAADARGEGSARDPRSAMVATHRVPAAHGAMSNGAMGVTNAASRPAGMPISITNPATGTASRFAGSDTSGRRWNTSQLGKTTPTWAPSVTARGTRSHSGPGRRSANGGATRHTPAVAPVDSQNPTDQTSIGSTSTRIVTVQANSRTTDCWTAEHERRAAQHGHDPRTQDRRLEPGQGHEPADQRQRGRPPPPWPHTAQQR